MGQRVSGGKRWRNGRVPVSSLVSRISVVGVPSSAASYAAGQDLAPAALRSAGLLDQLVASGLQVHDEGDLPHQIWRPDRDHPLAQNAGQATASVQQLADRLHPLLARGDIALVLGGNCTIALGVVAALRRLGAGEPGLLYVDRHYDLNTPESIIDGALDWMGLAHALALPGCLDTLADAFGPRPLLQPHQVAWLGIEPQTATQWEREQADRLGLHVTTSQALAADPEGAALAAYSSLLPLGLLAVHVDVDDRPTWHPMPSWRRTPTAATPDLPWSRPQWRSWRRRAISGCGRCRSGNSTRPAAFTAPEPRSCPGQVPPAAYLHTGRHDPLGDPCHEPGAPRVPWRAITRGRQGRAPRRWTVRIF